MCPIRSRWNRTWSSSITRADLPVSPISEKAARWAAFFVARESRTGHYCKSLLPERLPPLRHGTPAPPAAAPDRRRHRGGSRPDRKSVVLGKRVSVRVDLGGRRIIKKNIKI